MNQVRVAVLMTVHNRSAMTQRCLRSLRAAVHHLPTSQVRVFMTDDGCTDDTIIRARATYEDLLVIPGSGSLYWAAGMAKSEQAAVAWDPDLFLWINDDVVLDEHCLPRLFEIACSPVPGIAIGATCDPDDGNLSYGAVRLRDRHPQRVRLLPTSHDVQLADTFHGNVVVIPRAIRDTVGAIDGHFAHAYADFDYGLRATGAGVQIRQAPGFAGTCRRNAPRAAMTGGLRTRWRNSQDPVTGLPWRSQVRFLRRHAGWEWPLYAGWSIVHRLWRG